MVDFVAALVLAAAARIPAADPFWSRRDLGLHNACVATLRRIAEAW